MQILGHEGIDSGDGCWCERVLRPAGARAAQLNEGGGIGVSHGRLDEHGPMH